MLFSHLLLAHTFIFTILNCTGLPPPLDLPMATVRRPAVGPVPVDRIIKSRFSDQSLTEIQKPRTKSISTSKNDSARPPSAGTPVINISVENNSIINNTPPTTNHASNSTTDPSALADELDYITITTPAISTPNALSSHRTDKASRILGIKHRRSMEPIPASARNSIVSTRSARDPPPMASFVPTLPLTSLYVVSGLPKSPHTWTLADPDSVMGLHHSDGAVSRWWRPEVLGSTVSPGAGGGKKKKRGKNEEVMKGAGALSKQEVGKMLSKALKVSETLYTQSILSTFIGSSLLLAKLKSSRPLFSRHLPFILLPLRFLRPIPLWLPRHLVTSFAHLSSLAPTTVLLRQLLPIPTLTTHLPVLLQLTSVRLAFLATAHTILLPLWPLPTLAS